MKATNPLSSPLVPWIASAMVVANLALFFSIRETKRLERRIDDLFWLHGELQKEVRADAIRRLEWEFLEHEMEAGK